MAEEGCKLFVYGIDQNMANGDIQVTNYEVEDGRSKIYGMKKLNGEDQHKYFDK